MVSFKSTPLSSLLLVTMLVLVTVMLIVPQIDPPPTAFQRDSSPLAVHRLSHHVPLGNAKNDAIGVSFRVAESSDQPRLAWSTRNAVGIPVVSDRILRC